jgi:hypothetical protein
MVHAKPFDHTPINRRDFMASILLELPARPLIVDYHFALPWLASDAM